MVSSASLIDVALVTLMAQPMRRCEAAGCPLFVSRAMNEGEALLVLRGGGVGLLRP